MATFDDFKSLGDSLTQEQRSELFQQYSTDKSAAISAMIALASQNNMTFTESELTTYVNSLIGEDSETADQELSVSELASVSGGKKGVTWGCMGWDGR